MDNAATTPLRKEVVMAMKPFFSSNFGNASSIHTEGVLAKKALESARVEVAQAFNARSQDKPGQVLPVLITIYNDKSFDFVIKTPPAAVLIMEAIKIQKGSKEPNRSKVGSISWDQVKKIAETKMPDLNAFKVESAMKMIAGTARSMGVTVSGAAPWDK